MNGPEAVILCRAAKAACPQQAIDSHTPDMWHKLLEDISFQDAEAALIQVVKRQAFVAPAEIRSEVFRQRRGTAVSLDHVTPPAELLDTPERYTAWRIALVDAARNGATEEQAIDHANRSQGIQREVRAIEASPAAEIKARMAATALELSRSKSLAESERLAKVAEFQRLKAERKAQQDANPEDPQPPTQRSEEA